MKTTIGIITAAVMSVTVIGCGADESADQVTTVDRKVQPDRATRSPAGGPGSWDKDAPPPQ
jgi:hypothetical protein